MPAITAKLGYVGNVSFGFTTGLVTVRANTANVRASQEISYPDVVDGRIDRTLYQVGPRIVGGNVAFPLVHEGVQNSGRNCGSATNLGSLFWSAAAKRDDYGRLVEFFPIHIRYTDNTAFTYPNCIINSMEISVAQSDQVKFSCEVIGGANSDDNVRLPKEVSDDLDYLAPARVVTWNDFVIRIWGDTSSGLVINGDEIRSFNVTLNNNAERYYTLNNRLSPQDVAARKREISGQVMIMGRNVGLSDLAYTNQNRFTSTAGIAFGYTLGSNGNPYWATGLHGVVFEIEEIEITNDLADCDANYEATQIGTDSATNPLARPSSSNYGGGTATGFPGF
jgi:hypothetical protein